MNLRKDQKNKTKHFLNFLIDPKIWANLECYQKMCIYFYVKVKKFIFFNKERKKKKIRSSQKKKNYILNFKINL